VGDGWAEENDVLTWSFKVEMELLTGWGTEAPGTSSGKFVDEESLRVIGADLGLEAIVL
jgi:hypothetical protein